MRPCSSATRYAGKHFRLQVVGHLGRRLQIDLLRLLDERIDDVGLPARVELLANQLVDLVAPRLRLDPRAHRLAARRQVGNLRHVELAVVGERERARNRRGGHQQHVRPQPLRAQRGALRDAEPVLLVDDHQPQLVERDRLLHQRVRADDEVRRAALDVREQRVLAAARACCRSAGRRGTATCDSSRAMLP